MEPHRLHDRGRVSADGHGGISAHSRSLGSHRRASLSNDSRRRRRSPLFRCRHRMSRSPTSTIAVVGTLHALAARQEVDPCSSRPRCGDAHGGPGRAFMHDLSAAVGIQTDHIGRGAAGWSERRRGRRVGPRASEHRGSMAGRYRDRRGVRGAWGAWSSPGPRAPWGAGRDGVLVLPCCGAVPRTYGVAEALGAPAAGPRRTSTGPGARGAAARVNTPHGGARRRARHRRRSHVPTGRSRGER